MTKYFQGADELFFRDLGRSMHYVKGALGSIVLK